MSAEAAGYIAGIPDTESIQSFQDTFAETCDLTVFLVDGEGRALTAPSKLRGFCRYCLESGSGLPKCAEHISAMPRRSEDIQDPVMVACPHAELLSAAAPVYLDGTLPGGWICGQARTRDLEERHIENAAKNLSVAPEKALATFEELPETTRDEFDGAIRLPSELSPGFFVSVQPGSPAGSTEKRLRILTDRLRRAPGCLSASTNPRRPPSISVTCAQRRYGSPTSNTAGR